MSQCWTPPGPTRTSKCSVRTEYPVAAAAGTAPASTAARTVATSFGPMRLSVERVCAVCHGQRAPDDSVTPGAGASLCAGAGPQPNPCRLTPAEPHEGAKGEALPDRGSLAQFEPRTAPGRLLGERVRRSSARIRNATPEELQAPRPRADGQDRRVVHRRARPLRARRTS